MKRWIAPAMILLGGFAALGCGQHSSANRARTMSGQSYSGKKPTTQPELMQDAITRNDHSEVVRLLKEGLDINTVLPDGRTPLIDATVQMRIRIMATLLKEGADRERKGTEGKTALEFAVAMSGRDKNGKPVVNRSVVLLDPSAQISSRKELMKYAGRGSADPLLRLLLDVGVDPNFVAESGDTPLTLAIRKRKVIAVQVLAHWKDCPSGEGLPDCLRLTPTDVNLPDASGKTPLELARESKPPVPEIVDALVELKAKE